MDQNGPFWPEEVHSGPFRSANRTLAIPERLSVRTRSQEQMELIAVSFAFQQLSIAVPSAFLCGVSPFRSQFISASKITDMHLPKQ